MDIESYNLLIDTVRRFVNERLVPNEDRVEADDAVPEEIIGEMRSLGLFGLSILEEFDGLGLSMSEEAGVIRELGRTSLGFSVGHRHHGRDRLTRHRHGRHGRSEKTMATTSRERRDHGFLRSYRAVGGL